MLLITRKKGLLRNLDPGVGLLFHVSPLFFASGSYLSSKGSFSINQIPCWDLPGSNVRVVPGSCGVETDTGQQAGARVNHHS